MLTVELEHDVKLILCVLALDGRQSDLDRDLLAAVVQLHGIRHLDAHGDDCVAVRREDRVDESVLDFAGFVPCGIVVLAVLTGNLGLDVEHAALVVPGVGKAVHNDDAVASYRLRGGADVFDVLVRRIRRLHGLPEKRPGAEVLAAAVEPGAFVLGVDQGDLVPVAGDAVGKIQRRQRFAAARRSGDGDTRLGFGSGDRFKADHLITTLSLFSRWKW